MHQLELLPQTKESHGSHSFMRTFGRSSEVGATDGAGHLLNMEFCCGPVAVSDKFGARQLESSI